MIVKFRTIANFVAGQSPESKYYSDTTGVPFLQGNRTFGSLYPTIDTYTTKVTKIAKKGDILMSVRAPVGDLNFANKDICIGRGLAAINSKIGDNEFLFYVLRYNIEHLKKQSNGTTFDSITKDVIEDMDLIIPDKKATYEAIKRLLFGIDKQIDVNNKIISILTKLSESYYSRWFLQYDFPDEEGKPYKSSGGLMIFNEITNSAIPADWKIINIKEICKLIWGQCPDGKNILPLSTNEPDAMLYCSGAGDMRNGMVVDCQAKTNASRREAENGDILMSVAGSIGALCICDKHISLGRAAVAFRPEKENLAFCYFVIKKFVNRMMSVSSGSIQKVVNDSNIDDINFAYDAKTVKAFGFVNNIIKQCVLLSKENEELKLMRDRLLPLLMNGQVSVNNL